MTSRWHTCVALLCVLFGVSAQACDLCAIYRATNARGESSSGFLLTLSEQFVHYGTLQFEGERYQKNAILDQARLDTSLTHIVPAYNFSEQFGVSLNLELDLHSGLRFSSPRMRSTDSRHSTSLASPLSTADSRRSISACPTERSER